jgi:hypothetical protein
VFINPRPGVAQCGQALAGRVEPAVGAGDLDHETARAIRLIIVLVHRSSVAPTGTELL